MCRKQPNTLGYAFDDGPNCTHNAFYDFLQQQNQKASKSPACLVSYDLILMELGMFYIGSNVMDWPYEAQRGLADGHEICARE